MDMDAGEDSAVPPVDLTGLIPTSGSQLVFSSQPIADLGDYPPSQLYALDLKNGKAHDLGHAELSYTTVSQDQSILFVGGANAANDTNLFIVRLTDRGIVPATPISGFEGRPGNEYPKAWSGDGRYAFFERGSNIIGDGIDVVDAQTNSLLWYADNAPNEQSASVDVAPKGLWFAYTLGLDKRPASVAHIEHGGVKSTALPSAGYGFTFDADGTHMAYPNFDATTHVTKLFVQTLGGATVPIGDPDGYPVATITMFMPDGRVLAFVQSNPSADQIVNELLSTQGDAPVILGDETRQASLPLPSLDGSRMLMVYTEVGQDLAFIDPTGKAPDVPIVSYPPEAAVGDRAIDDKRFIYYTISTASASMGVDELHIVKLDGEGKVVDTRLDTQDPIGTDCYSPFTRSSLTKLVFLNTNTKTLNLIDLRGDTPKRVAMLAPSVDGARPLYCPMWGPNGDAFAYTEISDTSSRIRLVRWGDGAPEEPRTVYETDAVADVMVLRP